MKPSDRSPGKDVESINPERPKALYLSYTGILDPLGQSQILPYHKLTKPYLHSLDIISFEKVDRLESDGAEIQNSLSKLGIRWLALKFSKRLGRFGKAWDVLKLYSVATYRTFKSKPDIIHARGYTCGQVGLLLKKVFGCSLIFDMRSFWADQRVDGGIWSLRKRIDRWLYNHYKNVERRLIASSDQIVTLTESSLHEIDALEPGSSAKCTVIPCCADFAHFTIDSQEAKLASRSALGISSGDLVVGYLGSLGTWYLLDEMLDFFASVAHSNQSARMLFVTGDWTEIAEQAIDRAGLRNFRESIIVKRASRDEVPRLLNTCDVMISLFKPGFSNISVSPTKFAEAAACGVPTICNVGIGDMDSLIQTLDAGVLVDLSEKSLSKDAINLVREAARKGGLQLRARAEPVLGLERAGRGYLKVYSEASGSHIALHQVKLNSSSVHGYLR